MTVSSISPVNTYTGNSSTIRFDFDFLIENEDELVVKHINKNGATTILEYGIDYSIDEIGNANGSFIIFPLEYSNFEVLKNNEKISLMLDLEIKQEKEFKNSLFFKYDVLEWTFDYIVRILQILSRRIDRCVKTGEGTENNPEEILEELYSAKDTAVNNAQTATTQAQIATTQAQIATTQAQIAATQAQVATTHAQTAVTAYENAANSIDDFESDYAQKMDDFDDNYDTKLATFNSTYTTKLSDFNTNASDKTTAYNSNHTTKMAAYNTNDEEKITAYNLNHTSKLSAYNANDEQKTSYYNENCASQLQTYNNNAIGKYDAFDYNYSNKLSAFNSNATQKTNDYNDNCTSELSAYNSNASAKTTSFNGNYSDKMSAFNTNAEQKTTSFNNNYTEKYNSISGLNIDNKANKSFDNLSEEGEKHFLGKLQISNCIIQKPQNIIYTLVNGTVTIKEGSIIIIPYGTTNKTSQYPVGSTFINSKFKVTDTQFANNKFFVWAQTQEDLSFTLTGISTNGLLKANITNGVLTSETLNVSGSSLSSFSAYTTWYDASNNLVKRTTNGSSWLADVFSLPFMKITVNSSAGVTTINEVFDGMGYIGSTVWTDKGIKGLIPNGKNADGTFKNIEVTTTSFNLATYTNSVKDIYVNIRADGNLELNGERLYDIGQNLISNNGVQKSYLEVAYYNGSDGVVKKWHSKDIFKVTDCSALSNTKTDGEWVGISQALSNATSTGTYTIDLSGYLPKDNNVYEVIFGIIFSKNSGNNHTIANISTDMVTDVPLAQLPANSYASTGRGSVNIPLKERAVILNLLVTNVTQNVFYMKGYRRIGSNV